MSSFAEKPVPLLDVRAQLAPLRAEVDAAIARVLDHGQFILGPEVAEFEAALARRYDVGHAIACASGSDALLLALMALAVRPGDLVVTTPYSFFATASSITRLGARPLFVDIDPLTYNLDAGALSALLASLSGEDLRRVKAVIPVHLYGQCADMDPILETCAHYGLPVVEDAAQAIGAQYRGRPAGTLGLCGCFSFFPSKNLGCIGDGGALTTSDDTFAAKLRILRTHGAHPKYYHRVVGINSRLDTIHAAVLLVKLRYLDAWEQGRRANAARYRELLGDTHLGLPVEAGGCDHVYNQFVVRARDRDGLMQSLRAAQIGCEIYYPVPLHLQECFADLGYRPGDFPHSEAAARETLALPIQPELAPESIARIAGVLIQHDAAVQVA